MANAVGTHRRLEPQIQGVERFAVIRRKGQNIVKAVYIVAIDRVYADTKTL